MLLPIRTDQLGHLTTPPVYGTVRTDFTYGLGEIDGKDWKKQLVGDVIRVGFRLESEEILLSKREIGDKLGYSVRHIEKLAALGMPSEVWGRRRMYRQTQALKWLVESGRTSHGGRDFRRLLEEAHEEFGRGRLQPPAPPDDRDEPPDLSA